MTSEKSNTSEAFDYYNKSPEIKAQAARIFTFMDANGDGTITKKEFSRFLKRGKFFSKLREHSNMFEELDEDNSGKLDFDEFITFVHKVFTWSVCDGCDQELNQGMPRLTCAKCFRKGRRPFDLCSSCHSDKKYKHKHEDFQEFGPLVCEYICIVENMASKAKTAAKLFEAVSALGSMACTIM